MRYLLALAFASVASGAEPSASITYLRSSTSPELVMYAPTAMSGDGRTVVGKNYLIWSESNGLRPTGFAPNLESWMQYLAISTDGKIGFGELLTPADMQYFWNGSWGLTILPRPALIDTGNIPQFRRILSGDGRWLLGNVPGYAYRPCRMDRNGTVQEFPFVPYGTAAQSINFDGSVVVGTRFVPSNIPDGVVWIVPPGASASAADAQPPLSNADLQGVSANGLFTSGARPAFGNLPRRGVLWKINQEDEDFLPPLGSASIYWTPFVSNDGEVVSGTASRSGWPRAFVRRRGEQARDLRTVLIQFGAMGLDYYLLTDIAGMSDDGTKVCGFAQSPWYGNVAFVATIPEWPACPADINFDGAVDDSDFLIFVAAYDEFLNTDGDFNVDGATDDADFGVFVVGYDRLVCES